MPIPNADQAIVEPLKIHGYLLNPEHPEGAAKAAWFQSIGYGRTQWQSLAADLLGIARHCVDFQSATTVFGVKYIARGELGHPKQRARRVLTVWIAENNEPPRLVTAYPDDEP